MENYNLLIFQLHTCEKGEAKEQRRSEGKAPEIMNFIIEKHHRIRVEGMRDWNMQKSWRQSHHDEADGADEWGWSCLMSSFSVIHFNVEGWKCAVPMNLLHLQQLTLQGLSTPHSDGSGSSKHIKCKPKMEQQTLTWYLVAEHKFVCFFFNQERGGKITDKTFALSHSLLVLSAEPRFRWNDSFYPSQKLLPFFGLPSSLPRRSKRKEKRNEGDAKGKL